MVFVSAAMRIHMSESTFKYLEKFTGYYLADRGSMDVKVVYFYTLTEMKTSC